MNCSLSPESTRQHRSAEPGDAVWVYAAQKPCDEVASEAIDSTSSSSYDDVDVSDVGGTLTTESTSSHETPRNMFSSLSKEKQKMVPPKNGRVGSASARQEVDVKTRQEVDVKTRQKVDVKTRQEVDVKTKLACAWNNMKYGARGIHVAIGINWLGNFLYRFSSLYIISPRLIIFTFK